MVVPLLFLGVFFAWPVGALLRRAFDVSDGAGLTALLARTDAWGLLGFTLAQAAGSTVVALLVAAPIVWLVAVASPRFSTALMVLVTVPFVLPTVVVGMAFRALLGRGGPLAGLGWDGSVWSILAAHAFLNVAVIVRVVGSVWRTMDPRAEQAARTLGASPWRAFRTVVLPRLAAPVLAASALVFLFCASSFGVVLILGNGRWQTLETAIYTQAVGYFDIPSAVALSMVQIVLVVIVVGAARILTPRTEAVAGSAAVATTMTRLRAVCAAGAAVWTVILLVGPLAVVALRSFRPTAGGSLTDPDTWTLSGYR